MWRELAIKLTRAALPALRVVGMVYIGLGGVAALGLLATVALVPATPVLQQVAEPARQAVANLALPPTDIIVPFHLVQPKPQPTAVPFVSTVTVDITIDDASPTEDVAVANAAPVEPTPVRAVVHEAPRLEPTVAQNMDEDADASSPPNETADVMQPAAQPEIVMASVEAPKALPTPEPTLTPQELKARMDASNQAAIDAAKAEKAQAKAAADSANQAAIDALKVAGTTNAPSLADAVLVMPTPSAVQSKAAAKAAVEQAKIAAAKVKADANAANQAAIDAAKATKTAKAAKR
jgi:hypothetical protein